MSLPLAYSSIVFAFKLAHPYKNSVLCDFRCWIIISSRGSGYSTSCWGFESRQVLGFFLFSRKRRVSLIRSLKALPALFPFLLEFADWTQDLVVTRRPCCRCAQPPWTRIPSPFSMQEFIPVLKSDRPKIHFRVFRNGHFAQLRMFDSLKKFSSLHLDIRELLSWRFLCLAFSWRIHWNIFVFGCWWMFAMNERPFFFRRTLFQLAVDVAQR